MHSQRVRRAEAEPTFGPAAIFKAEEWFKSLHFIDPRRHRLQEGGLQVRNLLSNFVQRAPFNFCVVCTTQYCMNLPPEIRTNLDVIVSMRSLITQIESGSLTISTVTFRNLSFSKKCSMKQPKTTARSLQSTTVWSRRTISAKTYFGTELRSKACLERSRWAEKFTGGGRSSTGSK